MSATGYLQYHLRTVVHCAAGSIIRIPGLFEGLGAKRVLLISDAGLKQVGIVDQLISVFETNSSGVNPKLAGVYTDIAPDAACETVNEALRYAREVAADAILAVGGGSVLDAAKGVKYALHHQLTDIRDVIQVGVKLEAWPQAQPMAIPHIAVPTTAGTGAEVSPVAVFYNEQASIKGNLLAPFIDADMAVLDANLTLGLPPHLTASTGMDALTHALEAIASPVANHFTDAHGILAAQLIERNLPVAVANGRDVNARSTLLQASTMAINAFSNALNAVPVHNCAHAFGALYHIPHGDANAVLLPIVMEVLQGYYQPHARRLAQALNVTVDVHADDAQVLAEVVAAIRDLQARTHSPVDFAKYAIPADDMERIVLAIASDPAAMFYPIPQEQILQIAQQAIG